MPEQAAAAELRVALLDYDVEFGEEVGAHARAVYDWRGTAADPGRLLATLSALALLLAALACVGLLAAISVGLFVTRNPRLLAPAAAVAACLGIAALLWAAGGWARLQLGVVHSLAAKASTK